MAIQHNDSKLLLRLGANLPAFLAPPPMMRRAGIANDTRWSVDCTGISALRNPMSLDPNHLILTGENPFIRLGVAEGGVITTNASFWRILISPAGAGHVLYLKSELTQDRWKIYSDNIAMTRWLQKTVQGMLNEELSDLSIPVIDAVFDKMGDARDFWTERAVSHDEEVSLTWYDIGDPLLIHTQPGPPPARKYGVCTVLIPALSARLTVNGVQASGRPFPTQREGKPFSTCALAFSESWTETR